jgi:hypothetical protein
MCTTSLISCSAPHGVSRHGRMQLFGIPFEKATGSSSTENQRLSIRYTAVGELSLQTLVSVKPTRQAMMKYAHVAFPHRLRDGGEGKRKHNNAIWKVKKGEGYIVEKDRETNRERQGDPELNPNRTRKHPTHQLPCHQCPPCWNRTVSQRHRPNKAWQRRLSDCKSRRFSSAHVSKQPPLAAQTTSQKTKTCNTNATVPPS